MGSVRATKILSGELKIGCVVLLELQNAHTLVLCLSDIICSCPNKITGGLSHRASDQVEHLGLCPNKFWFFIILTINKVGQIMLSSQS